MLLFFADIPRFCYSPPANKEFGMTTGLISWSNPLNIMAQEASEALLREFGLTSIDAGIGAVLGTGWGDSVSCKARIPLTKICPIFNTLEHIDGHAREIGVATIARKRVLVAFGRVHMFEKKPEALYAFTRLLWHLGVRRLILTNASGGLRRSIYKGDIVVLDGLAKNGPSPLEGARFADHGKMLDPAMARRIWATCPVPMTHIGSYVYNHGPEFESDDDRALIDRPGVACVGMSTVPEASLWAYFTHLDGLRPLIDASVIPISCVSNGLKDPHGHDTNTAVLKSNSGTLGKMLDHVVRTISEP